MGNQTTTLTTSRSIIGTTMESGRKIRCMEMDILSTKTVGPTLDNSEEISHMGKEYLFGLMAKNMRVCGNTVNKMEKVSSQVLVGKQRKDFGLAAIIRNSNKNQGRAT